MKRSALLFLGASLVSCLFIGETNGLWWRTPSAGVRGKTPTAGVSHFSGGSASNSSLIPYFADGVAVGTLTFSGWTENSGIVRTQRSENAGYFWSNDDALVNPMQMRAIQISSATNGGAWSLTGATGVDSEDIASVTVGTNSYVYLFDSGDNSDNRASFNIFRVREPIITGSAGTLTNTTGYITIVATFPAANLPTHKDVECGFADPQNGDIYLITKRAFPIVMYSLPYADGYSGTQQLTYGGTTYAMAFSTQALGTNNGYVTGCDISPNGLEIVVKNYNDMYLFQRASTQTSIFATLQTTPTYLAGYVGANRPCSHPNNEPQGEAVAFESTGRDLYTASEYVTGVGGTTDTEYPLFKYSRLSSTYTTMSFQDGADSYSGTVDTYINSTAGSQDVSQSTQTTIIADYDSGVAERFALIKFDLSAVPSTATIVGCDLFLYVEVEGQDFELHKMYMVWFETSTYTSLTRLPLFNDVDAASVSDATWGNYDTLTGQIQVNIPVATIQNWITGSIANQGWVVYGTTNTDGAQYSSRESLTQNRKPRLVIRYI